MDINESFEISRIPELYYGEDSIKALLNLLPQNQDSILWITGGNGNNYSTYFEKFLELTGFNLGDAKIECHRGEPSPETVDLISGKYRDDKIKLVIGLGGGSIIDLAKAVSALLPYENSVYDFLEGVGNGLKHRGSRTKLFAIPTTSGTGSESTANAVLSKVGTEGFKKSIRHKNFVPDAVFIYPGLMTSCSALQTAACGMDAFTQLLEPFLSTKANPVTDSLAMKGLELSIKNLEYAYTDKQKDFTVRGELALASFMSGTCLANAGLGIVHGLAGPIGGYFNIPHGIVCAGLVAKANDLTLDKLRAEKPDSIAIEKMASIGKYFVDKNHKSTNYYCDALIDNLYRWQDLFQIPKFKQFGLQTSDIDKLVSAASNRNNPVELNKEEIALILDHAIN